MNHGVYRFGRLAVLASTALLGLGVALSPAPVSAQPLLPTLPIGGAAYRVAVDKPSGHQGYVYYTTGANAPAMIPGAGQVLNQLPGDQPANVVLDKTGHQIWRYTPPPGQGTANFRTQTYRGKPVLTWWQGTAAGGHGDGVDYIADEHGTVIDTLTPGDGLASDAHEFRLTPDGKALITAYVQVPADLTAIGGPADGHMWDCVASVIDVATKQVVAQWDAGRHVPITDTELGGSAPGTGPYDPYHMNSIALDPAGNLVISMRNTSAVYDVDPNTGHINWQLGGKHSTLSLGPGVQFAFQHDAQFSDPTTLRLFNDNSSGLRTLGPSSAQWIHLDLDAHRATLVRNQTHPDNLVAAAMGDVQALPGGDTLVGWGSAPHLSEFSPTGELLYDAVLPTGTYRAYLEDWAPGR